MMKNSYREAMSTLSVDKDRVITHEESCKLKEVLLNALIEINEVCKRNEITLFLCGGTLLGAIRHNGFIPWDDDLDIAITRKDFERFKSVFDKELGKKYELNAPNYSKNIITRFPKILIRNTVLKSFDNLEEQNQKIFIDVFLIDNIPDNRIIRMLKGTICQLFIGASSCVSVYSRDSYEYRKTITDKALLTAYKKRFVIGKLLSIKTLDWWLNKTDSICCYKRESHLVGLPTGRYHYFGEIFNAEDLFPPKTCSFEGNEFFAFNDFDKYLKNLHGDYMQIPPPEKRESHHIIKIDFGDL